MHWIIPVVFIKVVFVGHPAFIIIDTSKYNLGKSNLVIKTNIKI